MDYSQTITSTIQDILSHISFPQEITIETSFAPETDTYRVLLKTPDPSPIIGYHGETLSSLQTILGQHLYTQTNTWINLSLDVNDYRQKREISLRSLADATVKQVLLTGQARSLPPMPAHERRVIHLYLADHPKIITSSTGIGRSRSVTISPK